MNKPAWLGKNLKVMKMPRSNYSSDAAYQASKRDKQSRRKDIENAYEKSMKKSKKKYGGSNAGGAAIGGAG